MNCDERELDLALYSGGDLPAAQVQSLEQHLAACAHCRQVLDLYRDNRTALATPDPVDESVLPAIRTAVLGRIRSVPVTVGFFRPATALICALGAAAILVLAIGASVLRHPRYALPEVGKLQPPTIVLPEVPLEMKPLPVKRSRRPMVKSPEPPEEHVVVKFETEDPNIVVYWITD